MLVNTLTILLEMCEAGIHSPLCIARNYTYCMWWKEEAEKPEYWHLAGSRTLDDTHGDER